MPAASSKNTGPTCPGTRMFATFLAARGGGRTATHGRSISSAAGSRAKTSVSPAKGRESPAVAPASGPSTRGSFACCDRPTSSWRTSRPSLFEDSTAFSGTWPTSGTMRNGTVFRQPPLVPRISAGESSFSPTPRACSGLRPSGANRTELVNHWLPTPTATDGSHGGQITPKKGRRGGNLIEFLSAQMFPTPTAADGERGSEKMMRGNLTLKGAVNKFWNTPRADGRDLAGGSNSRRTAKNNGTYIGRTLNPRFVEWLMGFPLSWVVVEDE